MGYTHYYRNKRAYTDAEWAALTKDVKALFANCGVPIGNASGREGSSPRIDSQCIMFNGIEEDAQETASVTKGATDFEFCKTAHKPYDPVVVAFFKLIRKYAPQTELSSAAGDEVFAEDSGGYADKLDPDVQVTMEEQIASLIFERTILDEETAANLSKSILRMVLEEFRPDLFTDETEN
jgi:hypothetical protein